MERSGIAAQRKAYAARRAGHSRAPIRAYPRHISPGIEMWRPVVPCVCDRWYFRLDPGSGVPMDGTNFAAHFYDCVYNDILRRVVAFCFCINIGDKNVDWWIF